MKRILPLSTTITLLLIAFILVGGCTSVRTATPVSEGDKIFSQAQKE